MKLIMENWRKFEEKEKNRLDEAFRGPTDDPSFSDPGYNEPEGYDVFADKVSDIVDDVTRGQEFKMPNGQVLSYEDFGDGDGQYILDGDVFANSFDEAEEKLLDMMDMDSVMSSLNESQLTRLISEEIDRLIEEGLLEEGFKDKMMKFLIGTAMFTGALGGMPGKAQAEMTPQQATVAVTQAIKQELKNQGMTHSAADLKTGKLYQISLDGQKDDLEKLGKAMSLLSKAKKTDKEGDKKMAKYFAKQIIKLAPKNIDGKIKGKDAAVPNGNSIGHAADSLAPVATAVANKTNRENFKKKKATNAKLVNFDGAVANAFNGMQFAASKGDDAEVNKAVDHLFDVLDAAEKQGALDGKAKQAKKLLGKGDMQGFKKLMGY